MVNAPRVMVALGLLPLGLASVVAGLVIGYSSIPLPVHNGAYCGSAFGGSTAILNTNVEVACASILSERDSWATALLFIGVGLLSSSAVLIGPVLVAANPDSLNPTSTIQPPSLPELTTVSPRQQQWPPRQPWSAQPPKSAPSPRSFPADQPSSRPPTSFQHRPAQRGR
jgi:hypothetical protein